MIIFYRDVFERQSHIMAPLTDLAAECEKRKVGKKVNSAWKWEKINQDAFDECKKMLAKEAKLAFPDFFVTVSPVHQRKQQATGGYPCTKWETPWFLYAEVKFRAA